MCRRLENLRHGWFSNLEATTQLQKRFVERGAEFTCVGFTIERPRVGCFNRRNALLAADRHQSVESLFPDNRRRVPKSFPQRWNGRRLAMLPNDIKNH